MKQTVSYSIRFERRSTWSDDDTDPKEVGFETHWRWTEYLNGNATGHTGKASTFAEAKANMLAWIELRKANPGHYYDCHGEPRWPDGDLKDYGDIVFCHPGPNQPKRPLPEEPEL